MIQGGKNARSLHDPDNSGNPRSEFGFLLVTLSLFLALSFLARTVYPLFGLVVVLGIVSPILWGVYSRSLPRLGFTGANLSKALLWGAAAGVAAGLLGLAALDETHLPPNMTQQLIIGVPLWLLVISPFQEFFFRGLMQSYLSQIGGDWLGLLAANVAFTAWHYLSPLFDVATFPLASVLGSAATFLAGLIYGYSFMRSRSLVSPWLAHSVSGIIFILAGAMDLGFFLS